MKLTIATPKAIRYACQNFHYSKSVPSVQYGFNIYNANNEWCGVICYGGGANPHIGKPYGLCQGEILELVRVALNGKQHKTSQCVAATLRKLHQINPLVKVVVSYADMDQGHNGIIYQATNWLYEGIKSKGERCAFIVNGERLHPKTVYSKKWKESVIWLQQNVDQNAEVVISKGKHKYLYFFDKKLLKKYKGLFKEYP